MGILEYVRDGNADGLTSPPEGGGYLLPKEWRDVLHRKLGDTPSRYFGDRSAKEAYAMPAATQTLLADKEIDLCDWLTGDAVYGLATQMRGAADLPESVTILRDPHSAKPYVLFYLSAKLNTEPTP